ncbi:hypothetical protein PG997_005402 [Apiospora hydei]|uniref:Oxidase ustYa n=1 Tax=Apiospora hydei TaxID=1337664 RepID=A0ABR1X4U4_9PEZI
MESYGDISLRRSMSQSSSTSDDVEEKEQLLDGEDSQTAGPRQAKRRRLPLRILVTIGFPGRAQPGLHHGVGRLRGPQRAGRCPTTVVDAAGANARVTEGKGWIDVDNDTAIPYMHGMDQSLPKQQAMISVFHQLHCLLITSTRQYMTRAGYFSARAGNLDEVNAGHLAHCWDYLRQAIMCAGDTTLEWLHAPPDNIGSTGWGYQHTCKDYGALFTFAERYRSTDKKEIHGKINHSM